MTNRVARIDATGAYLQTSDLRVKKFFSPAPGLEAILGLNPKKYQQWNCLGFQQKADSKEIKLGKNCHNKIGFVAQEVRSILPEAVPATDSEEKLYSIDYSAIVACAVKAIQELCRQIED